MPIPSFVIYESEAEYRQHYIEAYCKAPVTTFDGYKVKFARSRFDHAFYKSSKRDGIKDCFSSERAERIDWIKHALEDPSSDLRVGWDKTRKRYDTNYRVAIIMGNYIVVISIVSKDTKEAYFVTAYLADKEALVKILRSPKWK